MSDSCRLRKLEPGLVAMYSRPSVLITSTMKSEPGRSTTRSLPSCAPSDLPACAPSFFSFAGSPCATWVAAAASGVAAAAAVAPAPAIAVFRNARRSTPGFLSSSITGSPQGAYRNFAVKSLTSWVAAGTPFRSEEFHVPHRRKSMTTKIMPLADAVGRFVKDGQTVALEGFTHLIPFAAGHEVIRQGKRELTLVRMTPDIIYDQLIGMGCASGLVFSWGGNPGVGSIHRFRDAIENGWPRPLAIQEHSHADMAGRYQAGASGL